MGAFNGQPCPFKAACYEHLLGARQSCKDELIISDDSSRIPSTDLPKVHGRGVVL